MKIAAEEETKREKNKIEKFCLNCEEWRKTMLMMMTTIFKRKHTVSQ